MTVTEATSDLEAFRTKCVAFLDQHATGISVAETEDPRHELTHRECVAFQQAAAEAGLAGLTYPVEFGGQGLSDAHQRIWRDEASKYPLMTRNAQHQSRYVPADVARVRHRCTTGCLSGRSDFGITGLVPDVL